MRVPAIELMKKGTKICLQPWMFQDLQVWVNYWVVFDWLGWLVFGWWMFESSGAKLVHWRASIS